MIKGILTGQTVILDDDGKPVSEDVRPPEQEGYRIVSKWVDTGQRIIREYSYEPLVGSEQSAAIMLARQMAGTLDDAQALKVKALYPQWDGSGVAYTMGDRLTYQGDLYKVLQSHTSQADWSPDKAPSLFAKVLPGQDGTAVGEWKQPDSTNPYSKGDKVTHKGKTWESLVDGNVWEPGATGVRQWKQI
jgi:hypothetical protein